MSSPKVPTPVVDKNGRSTTVHKNADSGKMSRAVPQPTSTAEAPSQDSRTNIIDNGKILRSKNIDLLTSEGLDPYSNDDKSFGSDFVYCASHVNVHSSGWCTVPLYHKLPMNTPKETDDSLPEARDEARLLGLRIFGDD